jgi:hypothetical protein
MANAPSYWSLAARTLPPTEPILTPSPILFRPENSPPVSDQLEAEHSVTEPCPATLSPVVNEVPFRPMMMESTKDWDQALRLSKEPDRQREATLSASTPIGISLPDQSMSLKVQRPEIGMQPNHVPLPSLRERPSLRELTQESGWPSTLIPPANLSVSLKSEEWQVLLPKSEPASESNLNGREPPTLAATSRVETARLTAVELSKPTSEFMDESKDRQETLARLQPAVAHADWQSAAHVDKSLRAELTHEASKSNIPPLRANQANEGKPNLRIGSIVVHIEKAASPTAKRPTVPSAIKPNGTLARSFSSFGFHQN